MTAVRAIQCPSCGGTIEIKAAGYSITLGCQYCGALLDVAHPDVAVIEEYHKAARELPIPLGRRGTLFGTEWEVIGALHRTDGETPWYELLLFNPYAGYRWLVRYQGGWQFGTMLADRPVEKGDDFSWRGSLYSRDYEPSETETDRVVGEFYWRVRKGDRVWATSYSRGDEVLSAEWTDDELNWTQLIRVSPIEIRQAFALNPLAGGSGGLSTLYEESPAMKDRDPYLMCLLALGTLLLSLTLTIAAGITTDEAAKATTIEVGGQEQEITIGTIKVDRPYQIVTTSAYTSSFDNRWIDIDYTLVNRATQRGYTAYGVVEHYSGTDSDGPWTEGSYSGDTTFSSIPRGEYDVVADLSAHRWGTSSQLRWDDNTGSWADPAADLPAEVIDVKLYAYAGGMLWGNFWLEFAFLLGLPLAILWWRRESGEDG